MARCSKHQAGSLTPWRTEAASPSATNISGPAAYEVVEDGVYFIPASAPDAGYKLRFLRFATGAVEPIHDFEGKPAGFMSVAPDGRSILFGQVEPMEADLMLVENFR